MGERIDTVVVGAGPYGLAAAAHLDAAGISYRAFGSVMSTWTENMPAGMFLKSTAYDTDIGAPAPGHTLADYCRQAGITALDEIGGDWPIPLADFVGYARWFQKELVLKVEDVGVQTVALAPGGYRLELDSGEELYAKSVVLATGLLSCAHLPSELQNVARTTARVSHSSEHVDFTSFAGRTVGVVGAGQSALETAVLLVEAGASVHLLVRAPVIQWGRPPPSKPRGVLEQVRRPASQLAPGWAHLLVTRYASLYRHLPVGLRMRELRTILGPAGAWWLRPRFSDEITVGLGARVLGADERGDHLEVQLAMDGATSTLAVDHLIAATGYRYDLSSLSLLDSEIRASAATARGFPRLSSDFESSAPGLFLSGFAAAGTFGPMLRFVTGTDFAARKVTSGVQRRLQRHRTGALAGRP